MINADNTPVPIGAVKDPHGVTSELVENEIMITPKDDLELQDFLNQTVGVIVGSNAVPAPQAWEKITAPMPKATAYLIQIDPSKLPDASNFETTGSPDRAAWPICS